MAGPKPPSGKLRVFRPHQTPPHGTERKDQQICPAGSASERLAQRVPQRQAYTPPRDPLIGARACRAQATLDVLRDMP